MTHDDLADDAGFLPRDSGRRSRPSCTVWAGSTPEEADVGVFNGMFPIQPGKEEDARAFATEALGARRAGYEAHHARADTTRETWAIQETGGHLTA